MLTLLTLLMTPTALAEDCDSKQLVKDIEETSPVKLPALFLQLAECDAEAAKGVAGEVVPKLLHSDEANKAALASIDVGEREAVITWVKGLEPNHRTQTLMWMGEQCGDVPEVGDFFTDSAADDQEGFRQNRWYRGMSKCRTEGVQSLLVDIVEKDAWGLNREQLFGFIEVYSRNLGEKAVSHLKSLPSTMTDPKDIRLIINSFADAANVGSLEGMNDKAAKDAIAALTQLVPQIPAETIEQARDTLLALGDEALAAEIVKYRWPDRKVDETYNYGVVAIESATCKNGKTQVWLHSGYLTNISAWPDAIASGAEEHVLGNWGLDHGAKCKGTSEYEVFVMGEPATEESFQAFVDEHSGGYKDAAKSAWKSGVVAEEPSAF